ncbi:MAG: hypothetical protein NTY19_30060 [Planctomycetota bacterium]|nr:hypothetical protein [Planctomycetota bacterium]
MPQFYSEQELDGNARIGGPRRQIDQRPSPPFVVQILTDVAAALWSRFRLRSPGGSLQSLEEHLCIIQIP